MGPGIYRNDLSYKLGVAFLVASFLVVLAAFNTAKAQEVQGEATCTPANVATIGSDGNPRIHVFCRNIAWHTTNRTGVNFYFAAPASDPLFPAIAAILANAMAQGRNVHIKFAPAGESGGFGCQTADCRRIVDVWMGL